MDITDFMAWFVSQVVSIFTKMFNILDNITFAGTSLLKVMLTISILSALLPVLLTIVNNPGKLGSKSERVKPNERTND